MSFSLRGRSRLYILLLGLALLGLTAGNSHAVRIRINHSNPNGFTYNAANQEYTTNSPVWLADIMDDAAHGGYGTGPFDAGTGLHDVIFTDSATYDLHADKAAATTAGHKDFRYGYGSLDKGGMMGDGVVVLGSLSDQ